MKMLYITHLSGKRINRLWLSAILAANELNIEFHLACNMSEIETISWNEDCNKYGIIAHHIDFNRNPLSVQNIKAYQQLMKLLNLEIFDLVHCNTPIGGVLGRICAHKAKVPKVIYMAHGFHFWKGAPLRNWLFYYPVELLLSKLNNVLITINNEDFSIAKKYFSGEVCYVHGVGVDIKKINKIAQTPIPSRKDLGIAKDSFVIVSVGELNNNKNQEVIIRALKKVIDLPIYYLVCGNGVKKKYLQKLVNDLELSNRVQFLGFRDDIVDIIKISDTFIISSKREGLSTALMEAMAIGLPCIATRIRGNVDLQRFSKYLFNPEDIEGLTALISKAYFREEFDLEILRNIEVIKQFDIKNVVCEIKNIYKECF